MSGKTLQIHLDDAMRIRAESGHFNFIDRIRAAVEGKGWQVQILPETPEAPAPGHFALHHMSGPPHRRAKIFRRCYYYPYWNIESVPQRWRWPVAQAKFRPDQIDGPEARRFIHQLRQRIMPGLTPTAPQHVLIPLQGQLTEARSFQTMSPVEMVEAVARTGKRCIATLHPNHTYEKVVFDPWQQTTWDVNDSCAPRNQQTGDPRTDPDIAGYVAAYFKGLPADPAHPWKTWFEQRSTGALGQDERNAAERTAPTPTPGPPHTSTRWVAPS